MTPPEVDRHVRTRPVPAMSSVADSTATSLFWQLATQLQAEDDTVTEGTIMNGRCLRARGEFLALVDYKGCGLVVKLSRLRVDELIAEGVGQPFAPAGRVFRQWVSLPEADGERWLALLREGAAMAGQR